MQSIGREVNAYFKFQPAKNKDTNNIILAQHCRHAIVHDGGKANSKTIAQIKDASPRTVNPSIINGKEINFTEDEIKAIAISMQNYFDALSIGIAKNLLSDATDTNNE